MNQDLRLEAVLDLVSKFTQGEFESRVAVTQGSDKLNELCFALNILGKELEASCASKTELEELNEALETANNRLSELARLDPLTKLLNRRGLEEVLQQEWERSSRQSSSICAVLVDCDDLKQVNNLLGHSFGDLVLQGIAQRIKSVLRASDHLARIGGDEYLAILPDTRMQEGMDAAERMRLAAGQHPMRIGDATLNITVSLGVARLQDHENSIEEILSATRLSLQRSKISGKNRVKGSRALTADSDATAAELQLVLEQLCAGDEVRAVAQPIRTTADENVVGFELLSRRNKDPYSMPIEFFRVALENNVLASVDLACAKACIDEATERNLSGRVHINLFPSTLLSTSTERLLSLFPAGHNDTSYCIEISEQQCYGNPAALKKAIAPLKEAGIGIALDHVGFGRTSLETLLVLEPDIIKIDRCYIDGVASDRVKASQLERMVQTVQGLGAELVAEGVETRADLKFLTTIDLPMAQGFLWGEPI
ncbi:MAG TPA: sensor domain-containing diguanylate cyclase [Myxococcales bacterium]|nr:sensor domain-containing diguanylate cyclase [Myxococcales bacterium]